MDHSNIELSLIERERERIVDTAETIAAELRQLADQIARRTQDAKGKPDGILDLPRAIEHDVKWGVANLPMESLHRSVYDIARLGSGRIQLQCNNSDSPTGE